MLNKPRVTRLTGWRCTEVLLCFWSFSVDVVCVWLWSWCSCFVTYGTLIWWLLWAPLPVIMLALLLLCILFSTRLSVLECQCLPFISPATCFSHLQLHGFQQRQLFAKGDWCKRVLLEYSRARLLKMTSTRLTPGLISHLNSMQIGIDLLRKRSRRGGRRKQKQSSLNEHLPPLSLSLIERSVSDD